MDTDATFSFTCGAERLPRSFCSLHPHMTGMVRLSNVQNQAITVMPGRWIEPGGRGIFKHRARGDACPSV